jgi:hypothetical protein
VRIFWLFLGYVTIRQLGFNATIYSSLFKASYLYIVGHGTTIGHSWPKT